MGCKSQPHVKLACAGKVPTGGKNSSRRFAVLLCIELHHKREELVRKFVRKFILPSKLFSDRCLKGAEAQRLIPCVMFTVFREREPLLRYFEEGRASPHIRGL